MNIKTRGNEMRNFFNNKIDSYDKSHEEYMDTKKALVDAIDKDVNRVLDLGAGTGLELIYLFKKYPKAKVTVVDITENMLKELMKRDFANNVTCICGDFFEVDFGSDYDVVISTSALHHFSEEDKLKLYKKILNCLKEKGKFINCDKICMSQEEQDCCFREYQENPNKYAHMDTPLTKENECKILNEVGFNSVEVLKDDNVRDNYALIRGVK